MDKSFFRSLKTLFKISIMALLLFQKSLTAMDTETVRENSGFQFFYLEDRENTLTVNEIQKLEIQSRFIMTEKDFFHFNHRQSWHWIKIHPKEDTDLDNLLLEISEAKLEFVNFYFKDPEGRWQVLLDGYSVPLARKFKKHYFPVFPLGKHQPGSDFYLQIKGNLQPIPVKIVKQDGFEKKHLLKNIVYGIYIGFISFIIINNFIL